MVKFGIQSLPGRERMRFRAFGFSLIMLSSTAAYATERQLVHIHVDGIKIAFLGVEVPNADYDISAVVDSGAITALHFFGKDVWNQEQNLYFRIDEVRGKKQDFAQSKLPGSP